jgi:signal peptidase I
MSSSATDTAKKQYEFLLRYVLQSAGIILISAVLLRVFFVSSYVMAGTGMLPSVWPGDFLVAFKWSTPKRGDVAALRCPGAKERTCLKRVIGVEGDRIEFLAGQLVVNGQPSRLRKVSAELAVEQVGKQSWVIWPQSTAGATVEALVIPPGQVYLLNDKRSDNEDSRSWGPISDDELEGKVRFVWLSLDWFEGSKVRNWPRPRWHRMLRSID